ncbi:MAG TPA: hypothetical protein VLF90_02125 [Patescibacteria group bacterium]|nr:hypothetical protein [Patescibacteria group bacterium]
MTKKLPHRILAKLRPISPWYLLVAAVICGSVCVYSLRNNNLNMVKLRADVFQADKSGNGVEAALKNLREYVYAHMNTSLDSGTSVRPPIQLKYTYDRLVKAQNAQAGLSSDQVYTDAQTYCQQQIPQGLSGRGRVPCITEYVSTHGAAAPKQTIPTSLYQFDFVSPAWSPDLAGWSMLLTIIFFVLFVVRYGLDRWLKAELHDQL